MLLQWFRGVELGVPVEFLLDVTTERRGVFFVLLAPGEVELRVLDFGRSAIHDS